MDQAKVLLAWSSGEDSAWALHVLRQEGAVEVVGLLTTFNEAFDRVAMHGVRRELVEAQSAATGLPLWPVPLPWPCSNAVYEERMATVLARARAQGITAIAFGDLFLQDVRDYRVRQLAGTGLAPLFPLWGAPTDTPALARRMVESGLRAVLTCVDPKQLGASFAGRDSMRGCWPSCRRASIRAGRRGSFTRFAMPGRCSSGRCRSRWERW
jgi:diphthamide synthase (EF-2-diphthine--ammonia ligase)